MRHKKIFGPLVVMSVILTASIGPIKSAEIAPIKPIPRELFTPVPIPPKIGHKFPNITPLPNRVIEQQVKSTQVPINTHPFILDPEVSWYGPGFYGNRTACGFALTKKLLGVAHKTLPCGTKVTFKYNGKEITVPVVDRGPYVSGRQWDLTGGLCLALDHCFTGPIYYRINK